MSSCYEDSEIQEQHNRVTDIDSLMDLECPECCSREIKWHCGHYTNSGVQNGRLMLSEVRTIFYAGCEECSATVKEISGDELALLLSE